MGTVCQGDLLHHSRLQQAVVVVSELD